MLKLKHKGKSRGNFLWNNRDQTSPLKQRKKVI